MKRMWYRTGMVEKPTKPGRGRGRRGAPPLGCTTTPVRPREQVRQEGMTAFPSLPSGTLFIRSGWKSEYRANLCVSTRTLQLGVQQSRRGEFFEMCCVNSLKSGRREKQKEPFLQNLVFEPIQANESYDAASGRCPVVFMMSTQSTQITSQPHSQQPRSGAGPGAGSHLRR